MGGGALVAIEYLYFCSNSSRPLELKPSRSAEYAEAPDFRAASRSLSKAPSPNSMSSPSQSLTLTNTDGPGYAPGGRPGGRLGLTGTLGGMTGGSCFGVGFGLRSEERRVGKECRS